MSAQEFSPTSANSDSSTSRPIPLHHIDLTRCELETPSHVLSSGGSSAGGDHLTRRIVSNPNSPLIPQQQLGSPSLPHPIGTWRGKTAAERSTSPFSPLNAASFSMLNGTIRLNWKVLTICTIVLSLLIYINTYQNIVLLAHESVETTQQAREMQQQLTAASSSSSSALTPSSPSPLAHQSHFLFPKPTSRIFISALPNRGAGLGHQFGEWVMGPWLAYMTNITYVYQGFGIKADRWNRFLGWGEGEMILDDLHLNHRDSDIFELVRGFEHYRRDPENEVTWLKQNINELSKQLDSPTATPTTPNNRILLVSYDIVHTLNHSIACHPELNLILRQKYCAQRIRHPIATDLYAQDRKEGKTVVAIHYRCGDSCFDYAYRTTPFSSIIASIQHVIKALTQYTNGAITSKDQISFHFFTQPPQRLPEHLKNLTAEIHFAGLFNNSTLSGVQITPHYYTSSMEVMHHLVTSDILLGSQSSFSWVANLLHHTVAIGNMISCKWTVPYDKAEGWIDERILAEKYLESKDQKPKYDTMQDCLNMKA